MGRALSCFILSTVILLPSFSASAQYAEDAFVGQKAPELRVGEWINSEPLTLEELRGRVVLIDFWAFDCSECAKTMPHLKKMHAKYSDRGLVIIGVHTPRATYEKDIEKVREAVDLKMLEYPVAIDNEYQAWTDYLCVAWPTHYVLDQNGIIQLSHTGIGRYAATEQLIEKLLAEGLN